MEIRKFDFQGLFFKIDDNLSHIPFHVESFDEDTSWKS
jgi:hypothetical protein